MGLTSVAVVSSSPLCVITIDAGALAKYVEYGMDLSRK
jgi:hypothetical protein